MHTKGPNHCMPTATDRTSRDPYGHGSRSASPHLPRSLASMPNAWSNKCLRGWVGGSTARHTRRKLNWRLDTSTCKVSYLRVLKSNDQESGCLPAFQASSYLEAKASWHLWIERSSFSVHACVRARTRKMTEDLFQSLAFSTRLLSTVPVCTEYSNSSDARRARARLQMIE